MKTLVWLFTFVILTVSAHAQSSKSIGLKTTGFFIEKTLRVITSPQFTWKKNKHAINIGPTILIAEEKAVSEKQFPKLSGVQFGYEIYPVTSDCAVNFKLFYQLNMIITENEWEANIWNTAEESYQTHRYVNNEFIFHNQFGYGIVLKLAKHINIHQGIGLGLYYSHTDNNEKSTNAPEIGDQNVNGYSPIGFTWGLNFGIEYSFNILK